MVKNLSTIQKTQVQPLGGEDPLEKGVAPHSSIFAWKILWAEELGGLQSMGSQRVGHDLATDTFFSHCILSGILSWKDNGSEFPQVPCFCRVPQALRCCFFTLTICRGHGRSKSMFRAHLRRMYIHSVAAGSRVPWMSVRSSWLIVLFKDSALSINLLPCCSVYIKK